MPNINDYGLPFTSEDGDRKYSALEWREYFSRLIHNGLIQNAANECQVKPQAVPNKTVYVDTGVVFINGAMRVLEEPVTLAVAENTSGDPRIDRVVARLNEASRTIEFAVLEGAPAGSPVAPALTRTAGVYELGLADITLANGYSTITAAEITDQRWDVSLCGASSMTIGVIPPSGLEAETVTLSEETAELYGVSKVDDALKKSLNLSSYMAFCSNVNSDSLDSAFGKNNESLVKNLGFQLAMYGWFKGDNPISKPFTELIKCDTFAECVNNAYMEIFSSESITAICLASPYAENILGSVLFTEIGIETAKSNKTLMTSIINNSAIVDKIRTDPVLLNKFNENRVALLTPGAVSWTVPADFNKDFITVQLVGGGGSGTLTSGGTPGTGKCGEYKVFVVDVVPNQVITGNIGSPGITTGTVAQRRAGNVTFAGVTALAGVGATQSGAFLRKSSDKIQNGFEGGKAGDSEQPIGGTRIGELGNNYLPETPGTGGQAHSYTGTTAGVNGAGGGAYYNTAGTGYGGAGAQSTSGGQGAGGSGAIVICF